MTFTRVWSMPDANTFSMPPVVDILKRWVPRDGVTIDPFARNSKWGTVTNDLNPDTEAEYHFPAEEFAAAMPTDSADCILFDPPYSPRQVAEVYQGIGQSASMSDTQTARLYRIVRDELDRALKAGGIAISFGWNSAGFGAERGYEVLEIVLIAHGSAHNDTIVVVERKRASQMAMGLECEAPWCVRAKGRLAGWAAVAAPREDRP